MKDIGLYIHIPFCKQKCYYCDFISYSDKCNLIEKYFDTLIQEYHSYNRNFLIKTVYIGGGTPSFVESKYIKKLLSEIDLSNAEEVTIEVNPGTVNIEKLKDYKEAGINRISIGLQATQNEMLKRIGRIHTYEEFLDTYKMARSIGYENINVDLMLALPEQKIEDIKESLEKIVYLKPEHISVYSLILEEGTVLEKKIESGELKLPDEDTEREMYWLVKRYLEEKGYNHYEISNFAKNGFESKHNMDCWKQKEYIGLGTAAHSYMDKKRYSNKEKIEEYIKDFNNKNINEVQDKLDEEKEYMILGLRTIKGVNISEFKNKFVNNPIYLFKKELNKLVNEELIEIGINEIRLTDKGLDFANLVWEEFV